MKRLLSAILLAGITLGPLGARQLCDTLPADSGQRAAPPAGAWSLDDCIAYALDHNIDVQQRILQLRQRETELSAARWSRTPNLNAGISGDASFGRTLAPDNTYRSNNQTSGSLSVSASVPVFEGLRINRRIDGAKLDLSAAIEELAGAREDVALNIMTLYLEVLYNREMAGIAARQLELSRSLALRSREEVEAGRKPESARYESEALCASDELALTQARNDLQAALLMLSQALNRESAAGFDILDPQLDSARIEAIRLPLSPEAVYAAACGARPSLRAEEFRLRSSENAVRAARAALYPSVSLSGGFGTGIYSRDEERFWTQFRNYSREYVGLSIQIPIFNRRSVRNDIRSARLAVESQRLRLTEAEHNLRKTIEQAWYNATAARDKYRAAEAASRSARTAFEYVRLKAEAGRATIYDFSEARTRMERAEAESVQARYELLFRAGILDYYAGQPLRL